MNRHELPAPSDTPAEALEAPPRKPPLVARVLLPLLAVGLGVGVFVVLVKTKPHAPRAERQEPAPLVTTMVARSGVHQVVLHADGTVVPARKVGLVPQVAGRVVWRSPQLQPGGRVRKGETLFRIEDRDYRLAVKAAEAQVAQARLKLRIEEGRKRLAEREWRRYGAPSEGEAAPSEQNGSDDAELALRGPQLQTARVAVKAAESALARARLNLSRTVVRAPFDAVVVESLVETGQLLGPQGGPAVKLVATDHFWVQVSVPIGMLPVLRVPSGEDGGSPAVVRQHLGGNVVERRGRVIRLLPDLARGGSMARVLVEIDDPLGPVDGEEPPLLLGAFVRVAIEADPLQHVFELPRAALREDDQVYLVTEEGRLDVRPVQVVWRDEHHVYVAEGLRDGERIVTSALSSPVAGMKLRVESPDASRKAGASGEPAAAGTDAKGSEQ